MQCQIAFAPLRSRFSRPISMHRLSRFCLVGTWCLLGALTAPRAVAEPNQNQTWRTESLHRDIRDAANSLASDDRISRGLRAFLYLSLADALRRQPEPPNPAEAPAPSPQSAPAALITRLDPSDTASLDLAVRLVEAALADIPSVRDPYPTALMGIRKQPYGAGPNRITRQWLRIRAASILAEADPGAAWNVAMAQLSEPIPPDLGCDSPVVPMDQATYSWLDELSRSVPTVSERVARLTTAMQRSNSLAAASQFATAILEMPKGSPESSLALRTYAEMLGRLRGSSLEYAAKLPIILYKSKELYERFNDRPSDAVLLTSAYRAFLNRRSLVGRCAWHRFTDIAKLERFYYSRLEEIGLAGYRDPLLAADTPPTLEELASLEKAEQAFYQSTFGQTVSGPRELVGRQTGSESDYTVLQAFAERMLSATEGNGPARRELVGNLLADWSKRGRPAGSPMKSVEIVFRMLEDAGYWRNEDSWADSADGAFDAFRHARPEIASALHERALKSPVSGLRHFANFSLIRARIDQERIRSNLKAEESARKLQDPAVPGNVQDGPERKR